MMDCKTALITVLDQIDYTTRACQIYEMVGSVLPRVIIDMARDAIKNDNDTEQNAAILAAGNKLAESIKKDDMSIHLHHTTTAALAEWERVTKQ
jgi:hypothetical protein